MVKRNKIKEVINLILKLVIVLFVIFNMVCLDYIIVNVIHERTHIKQIEEYGTATITEVCYYGKSPFKGSNIVSTAWVQSLVNASLKTGGEEPEAYANGTNAVYILALIDSIILYILLYYLFIDKGKSNDI